MKNTLMSITPTLPEAGDISTTVINMRACNGILVPATDPFPDTEAVACFMHPDGSRSVFSVLDREVRVMHEDSSTATVIGTLPAPFLCAAVTSRAVIFMTDKGPWHVMHDQATGTFIPLGSPPRFPEIVIDVISTTGFSDTAPAYRLDSPLGRWPATFSSADRVRLSKELYSARNRAETRAVSAGYFTAPMLAWYRIIDPSGNTLYQSSPVMIGCQAPFTPPQAVMKVTAGDEGYSQVMATSVTVNSFAIGLRVASCCDSPWACQAAAVELYVSPALAVTDPDGEAIFDFGTADSNSGTVTATLPLRHSPAAATIQVVDRHDTATRCIARVNNPFTGGLPVIPASPMPLPSAASRLDLHLNTALRTLPSMCDPLMAAVASPHSFSARTALVTGDMLLWGDITPVRALPESPLRISAKTIPAMSWTAVSRVTIVNDDNSREIVSATSSGTHCAPVAIGPFVAYPHPGAVEMEIAVSYADGSCRHVTVPLSPTPGRRMSCYLSDNCGPVELTPCDSPPPPVSSGSPVRLAASLLAASQSAPMNADCATEVACGRITALTPASKSSSAWDFARRHLYIFSTGGIHALSVNASRTLSSTHIIDSRGVDDPHKVAVTPQGVYAVTTGGYLLQVTASKAVTIMPRCNVTHLIYRAGLDELWGRIRTTRWLVADSKHRIFYRDSNDVISYTTSFSLPGLRPLPLRAVVWHVAATECDMHLSISGDNGSRQPAPITSIEVKGDVSTPVHIPVVSRPLRHITLRLSGNATRSMRFEKITLAPASWNSRLKK